jgi:hypothetical protein
MTTEVYERTEGSGKVERELRELGFNPDELYFGTNFASENDEDESVTTDTAWQQKLRLTTPSLAIDDRYVFFWYLEIKANLQNKNSAARIQVDDTTTILESEREGNEWFPMSGLYIATIAIAGTHTIDIDYRAIDGTAYIRRARLIGWKVE